jgi:hypothetical protein
MNFLIFEEDMAKCLLCYERSKMTLEVIISVLKNYNLSLYMKLFSSIIMFWFCWKWARIKYKKTNFLCDFLLNHEVEAFKSIDWNKWIKLSAILSIWMQCFENMTFFYLYLRFWRSEDNLFWCQKLLNQDENTNIIFIFLKNMQNHLLWLITP